MNILIGINAAVISLIVIGYIYQLYQNIYGKNNLTENRSESKFSD